MLLKRIGEIIVIKGYATQEQVNEALLKQNNFGLKLGETLIKLGYVTEMNLLECLHEQLDIEVVYERDVADLDAAVVSIIPEPFAVENRCLAIKADNDNIVVAMTDPENILLIDNLKKITQKSVQTVLIGNQLLTDALERHYKSIRTTSQVQDAVGNFEFVAIDENEQEINIGQSKDADAPMVKLLNIIIIEAIKAGATDIHIEPLSKSSRVRFRVDGALREVMNPPIQMHPGLVSIIKVMSKLNIAERRLPQDGHISLKTAMKAVDVRVSITPTVVGEKVVMRLLDKGDFGYTLYTLGFEEYNLKIFKKWIHRPYGIIIVSGPTGSGKSTTLHAAIKTIQDIETNIITVEDPVEYRLDGICQIETYDKIGLTFGSALRSALRQDPDVILVGEVRDLDTADIAIKFSLTGHLVFTTLHANDAPATVTRLIDIGIPAFLVGSSLNLVMAQRLVRKICPHCAKDYQPTPEEIEAAGLTEDFVKDFQFKVGLGCVHCDNTGYSGRTAIFEMLQVNAAIRKLIFDSANQDLIRDQALADGMKTLHESALEKMKQGITTIKEVIKITIAD
ncbi:MAG: Flp pilus assembly complex ATPase component TadA [Candidatus Cloacimonetes bacterium]|nr:Flp pilus assembly complex ATPase component TadA [Candidatus Cloacimonadota bacterium]